MRKTGMILVVVATIATGAVSALAASITSIGAISDPVAMSKVYALSADGNWAVGESPDVAGVPQAVVWSAGSGLVQLPNPGGLATSARGVAVMGNGDIGIAGYAQDGTFAYRMAAYRVAPSNLAGGTWYPHIQHNLTVGTYNAARVFDNGTGVDQFSIAGQRGSGARGIQTYEPGTSISSSYSDSGVLTGYARVYNVSSSVGVPLNPRGYAAGYERNTTTQLRRALFGITGSTQTAIPGSAGYQSEALGMTPNATNVAGVVVGYDQDTSASNFKHAFQWSVGGASMSLLNELPGDNQSEAIDVRVVGGSTIITGWSSDGTTEKAVVWTNGSPVSLASLLGVLGVDTSAWSSLSRITSMSDDGKTVAGWGIWAADGSTRGFVAVIPEPATVSLLVLGACVLFRRRR